MLRRAWFVFSLAWFGFVMLTQSTMPDTYKYGVVWFIALFPAGLSLVVPPILTWVRWGSFQRPIPAPRFRTYRPRP